MARLYAIVFWLFLMASGANATLLQGAEPLFQARAPAATGPSLFAGPQGLFAPITPRPPAPSPVGDRIGALLSLIAEAEAGAGGYDAVIHAATIRPPRVPTELTLGEIYTWIDATPSQHHAIGRYQFIPPTLRRVANALNYGPETQFTPAVQDALALVLLEEGGLTEFEGGTLDRLQFMRNLSRIWAGLPLPNGRSYYQGYAGNRATITWARFEAGMAAIWPM